MLPNDFPPSGTVYWWFLRFVGRLLFQTIHDVAPHAGPRWPWTRHPKGQPFPESPSSPSPTAPASQAGMQLQARAEMPRRDASHCALRGGLTAGAWLALRHRRGIEFFRCYNS